MKTIRAVYENGVFRPTDPIDLQESSVVEFEPRPVSPEVPPPTARDTVYAILSERYESGESDVAARHNEHQP